MVLPRSHRITRVRRYSGACSSVLRISCTGLSPSLIQLSRWFHYPTYSTLLHVRTPRCVSAPRFRLFPFRSPLLWKSNFFFLFLRVLRCFSSPRSLRIPYLIQVWVTGSYSCRVSPFGHPRFSAYLQLRAAFRSSLRPSSAPGAKAFTVCS